MSNEEKNNDKTKLNKAIAKLIVANDRIKELEAEKSEPIAIIGMACRFAGGINTLEDYWNALKKGRNTVFDIPSERWNIDEYYDPDQDTPGKMNIKKIGTLEDIDLFDAEFFRISRREAEDMDPQHRLLLETSWEALEDAGIPPDSLFESHSGVFTAILNHDYSDLISMAGQGQYATLYSALSYWGCIASGRISYFLGLNGPNIAIDTGCSASLITVHVACNSLRNRECDLAFSGGCNIVISPERVMNYCRTGTLSPSGACKTFSDDADGFARGEGCGILILKRLSDAIRDNNRIYAVVRGSAINHDGASAGLTVPNAPAQEKVIRAALKKAHLLPSEIDFIEAHGTGTPLGDPIEFQALNHVFKDKKRQDNELLVGAVKTNLGHLESAAGVASMIKVVLSLKHHLIPGNINFRKLNKDIDLSVIPAKIPLDPVPWEIKNRPRAAGISAFSLSGSNAHIIISDVPDDMKPPTPVTKVSEGPFTLILSAKTAAALEGQKTRLISFLEQHPNVNMADVAYTLQYGRQRFNHQFVVQCQDVAGAIMALKAERSAKVPNGLKQYGRMIRLPTYPFQKKRCWAKHLGRALTKPKLSSKLEQPSKEEELEATETFSLEGLSENEKRESIYKLLETTIRKVLKVPDDTVIENDRVFFELGMDSMLATELHNKLQKNIGKLLTIPLTIAFDYPSIDELARYLFAELKLGNPK